MLKAMGRLEEAIARLAIAAPLEERIAAYLEKTGDRELAARHRFSAAVCWAKTGNLLNAITLFDGLNRNADTPGRLKVDALIFANRLREQQHSVFNSYIQTVEAVG